MVNSIRLFFVLLLSLSNPWLTPGISQNYIDLLRIDYTGSPGNAFESGPGTSSIREWLADANIPVPVSKNNTILTGFLLEHIRVSLYPQQESVAVKTLGLKLGLNQRYSNKWSGSYRTYAQDDRIDLGLSALRLGDDRSQLNPDFEDGLVYKISVLYRLNTGAQ